MISVPDETGPTLTSDEDLRKANLGALPVYNQQITLAEYDPEWPRLFELEAARLRAVLGPTALLVEHAGSTSVPGLAAKPIIDMILAVPDTTDEAAYLPAMIDAGYVLRIREPDWYEHRLFKGPDTNINLHVFPAGCAEIDLMLRFRDWLRTHDDDRARYEAVKRDLAQRTWRYVQHYADSKTTVVKEIHRRMAAADENQDD
ncbi:MAG TPA: GrpB family protein [Pseudonocardiaceae bacterium]|jgi:GrpB-like predicted nucleotidyltransferase (UPF0157 family)|nr:GrpB family protein [Pseudonocardiaceae bacterium]